MSLENKSKVLMLDYGCSQVIVYLIEGCARNVSVDVEDQSVCFDWLPVWHRACRVSLLLPAVKTDGMTGMLFQTVSRRRGALKVTVGGMTSSLEIFFPLPFFLRFCYRKA